MLGDAAFDSEENHRYCREELGVRSTVIPLNRRKQGRKWPKTSYRRQMVKRLRKKPRGSRYKRMYGQRWQAESHLSRGTSDCLGSALRGQVGRVAQARMLPACTHAQPHATLALNSTAVTDAGLKELASLKGLQTLNLDYCRGVTDAGLKEVAALKGLRSLDLGYIKVTDAGLKELADLKGLQTLNLIGTQVTDTGLKQLSEVNGLQDLNLSLTRTTDAGLKELAAFKALQALDLHGTQVTDEGVAALQKALPDCKISR